MVVILGAFFKFPRLRNAVSCVEHIPAVRDERTYIWSSSPTFVFYKPMEALNCGHAGVGCVSCVNGGRTSEGVFYFLFFFAAADLLKQKSQRSDSWSLITCRKVDDGSLPPTYSCGVSARAHAHVSCGASQYFNHQPVRRISIQMEKRKSLAMEDPFPFLTLFASTLGRDTVHAIYWWLLQDFCQIQKSDFSFFSRYLACLFPRANYSFIQTVSLIRFT